MSSRRFTFVVFLASGMLALAVTPLTALSAWHDQTSASHTVVLNYKNRNWRAEASFLVSALTELALAGEDKSPSPRNSVRKMNLVREILRDPNAFILFYSIINEQGFLRPVLQELPFFDQISRWARESGIPKARSEDLESKYVRSVIFSELRSRGVDLDKLQNAVIDRQIDSAQIQMFASKLEWLPDAAADLFVSLNLSLDQLISTLIDSDDGISTKDAQALELAARWVKRYYLNLGSEKKREIIKALFEVKSRTTEEYLVAVMEHSGPAVQKIAQSISRFVRSPELRQALRRLEEEIPPMPYEVVRDEINHAWGAPLEQWFEFFEKTPLAAATTGQVHKARLKSRYSPTKQSLEVAVKVGRPGYTEAVTNDFEILGSGLGQSMDADFEAQILSRLKEKVLMEGDYRIEATNTDLANQTNQLSTSVRSSRRVVTVPIAKNVLVTHFEKIEPVFKDTESSRDELQKSMRILGRLYKDWLKRVFVSGFVHCDPHGGNIKRVRSATAADGYEGLLMDFGNVAILGEFEREGLMSIAFGYKMHDSDAVRKGMGIIFRPSNLSSKAISEIKKITDRSVHSSKRLNDFMIDLFRAVVTTDGLVIPKNLIEIQRAMLVWEGNFAQLTSMIKGHDDYGRTEEAFLADYSIETLEMSAFSEMIVEQPFKESTAEDPSLLDSKCSEILRGF